MNSCIDRDSDGMRQFVSASSNISYEMLDTAANLKRDLYSASGYMKDESGSQAIDILAALTEEIETWANQIQTLSDCVQQSAQFLEDSNDIL